MNRNQLELFRVSALEGSVTKGADRAAISQPAVSRAIAELEKTLGQQLFDRGPKGIRLTEAGTILLHYVQRIESLEQEAIESLDDLKGLRAGHLRIGASTTVGDHLLPKAVVSFLEKYPEIDLTLEVGNTEAIEYGVLEGTLDVGYTEGETSHDDLEVAVFAEDELVLVCSPSHPLAARAGLKPADLSAHRFVLREHGSGTRQVVEHSLRDAGVQVSVAASLGSSQAVKSAAQSGLGIAMISRLVVGDELATGALRELTIGPRILRPLQRIRLRWRRESAALREFQRELDRFLAYTNSIQYRS